MSVYDSMTLAEARKFDCSGRWTARALGISESNHIENVEKFYLEFLPRCAEEFPEFDPDKMYLDCSYTHHSYLSFGETRSFFAGYTPYGIRGIDSYFIDGIRYAKTIDDLLLTEEEIIYCPHLHIKLKENLIENLNNKLMRLCSGE